MIKKEALSKVELGIYIAVAVAALAVIIGVKWISPPCAGTLELANGNMVPMRCFYTSKIAILLGIIVFILAVAAIVTKRKNALPIILLGVALILITIESFVGIGVCKKDTMACVTGTAYWMRIGGGVIAVLGAALALIGQKHA